MSTYYLAGNLDCVKEGDTVVRDYAYDEADQITSGPEGAYSYDALGNLIRKGTETLSYDGFGRLASYRKSEQGPLVSFSYDPLGRLSERKEGGNTALSFRYDGITLAQAQETGAAGGIIATYALSPSGTHLAQKRQGTLSFLGLNPHSDVSFSLSSQGSLSGARVYDPYGNTLGGELDCPLTFQEDYQDPASGLAWMGARWYSPELTRFLSPDPLPGELDKPLSQNPYLYCADDPLNHADPTGKYFDPDSPEEPTLQWDLGTSGKRGLSPGRYWDSMADPIKEDQAAARDRAEERENSKNFVQKTLEKILKGRESLAEKGGEIWRFISSWDTVGENEIIEVVESWKDSANPFLRYIYWDQKARKWALRYGRHMDNASYRQFTNELAGVMAFIILEAGPSNLDGLNDVMDLTGASERVQEIVNRDFGNFEEAVNLLNNWCYAHEKRLEALAEIESMGYVVEERMITEDSPGGLGFQNRTAKSYWVGVDCSSPTGVPFAVTYGLFMLGKDIPSTKYWHPRITLSGDVMLGHTQRAPLSIGGWGRTYDYREGPVIRRPEH